jgi:hypothetical protein
MECVFFRLTTMTFMAWFIGKKGSDLLIDAGVPAWIGIVLCGISGGLMGATLWLL